AACADAAPVLVLSISPDSEIPAEYTMAGMVMQSSGLGMQAISNTLMRRGRAFEVCAGAIDDPECFGRAVRIAAAMSMPAKLRTGRMGCIGSQFAAMTDAELDLDTLRRDTGIETVTIPAEEWTSAYRDTDDRAVRQIKDYCSGAFHIADLTSDEFERSARLAASLETLVERHGLDFGAVNSHRENCLQNPEIGIMATLGVSLLTSRGIPLAE